jgi:hypothetical protein
MVAHFGCNLMVRHLIGGLNTHDAASEVFTLQAIFQFDLCLAGSKDQD